MGEKDATYLCFSAISIARQFTVFRMCIELNVHISLSSIIQPYCDRTFNSLSLPRRLSSYKMRMSRFDFMKSYHESKKIVFSSVKFKNIL